MAFDYLAQVAVEQYGPIGLLAAVLWYRQESVIRAVVTLAEEHPDVDEDKIEDSVKIRGD